MGRPKKYCILEDNLDYVTTHTKKQTMEHFGLSYNEVENFCYKNKIKTVRERRDLSEYVTKELIDFAKNHTVSQIAKEFDWTYSFTSSLLRTHNISCLKNKVKSGKYSEDLCSHNLKKSGEARNMILELSKTFTHASIARVFGYSKERIRQICQEEKRND